MRLGTSRNRFTVAAALLAASTFSSAALAAELPSEPPAELVRRTAHNELSASGGNEKYMFLDRKQNAHGSQTKLMVQTREAMAGLVVANDGKPLDTEQRQEEYQRVERFVNDPDELRKKQKQEKDDTERVKRIMRALPDAFLYQYDGTMAGTQGVGSPGDPLVRLKFRPNPDYNPPSRVEQVLTGMKGYLLIDTKHNRIAKIDGKLEKEVGFGWGILGHLDPGGHFLVEQGDVGDDHWEVTRMDLSFTGKILIFKSLNIQSEEVSSHFQPVSPDLTFAQGVDLLKKHEAEMAKNGIPALR